MSKKVSIVIPCFNESEGLPFLIARLNTLYEKLRGITHIEVIFVDDHSSDSTPALIKKIIKEYSWIKFQRLSKNSGSHIAIISGISRASGDCIVFLAADLQDPPELIIEMVNKWQEGNDVVWAVRKSVEGITYTASFFSKMFYRIMNATSSVKLPPTGADFALLDKRIAQALVASAGSNPSLGSLITWLGFRQTAILYTKNARQFGKSKWPVGKKLNSFLDAFVGFSYIPMRLMIYFGFTMAGFGFLYALFIIILKIAVGKAIMGWASIMVAVLIMGGTQMIMLGILGEYLWRNLEESRRRPLFLIEEEAGF
jgi:glycosyltransferase involved in cell wall biosynthesis